MSISLLSPELVARYHALRSEIEACGEFVEEIGDTEAAELIQQRLEGLRSAVMVMVVGEVKAGKSSFINALLGDDLCEVAPDPCTSVIREIAYGEAPSDRDLGTQWQQVFRPVEILRQVSIVDTPGTNSIIKNHHEITERYIPRCDLVIFVFPAKNPHTQSAWEFLSMIREEWRRKVIFVLQQSDLATAHELEVNTEKVCQYARENGVQNPSVFPVSAIQEGQEGVDSGFQSLRTYLRKEFEAGGLWRVKSESSVAAVVALLERVVKRLCRVREEVDSDAVLLEGLVEKVEMRKPKAAALRQLAVDSLCLTYELLAKRLEEDFRAGLSVSMVLRRAVPFIRDMDTTTWLENLQKEFNILAEKEIGEACRRVVADLETETRVMLEELESALSQHHKASEVSRHAAGREVANLPHELSSLRVSDLVSGQAVEGRGLGTLTLAGGGIAALGTAITLATTFTVVDITGGILTFAGAFMVAGTLLWKRTSIIKEVQRRLEASKSEFRQRIDGDIARIFNKLFLEVTHTLNRPLTHLNSRRKQLSEQVAGAHGLLSKLSSWSSHDPTPHD